MINLQLKLGDAASTLAEMQQQLRFRQEAFRLLIFPYLPHLPANI